mmetsp:Transcript_66397/g.216044  ORF Transcript_66397/g.216044 Transcript_66397/m.216044 type:complete len:512 (-) Transcript_66397:305-1840(-)
MAEVEEQDITEVEQQDEDVTEILASAENTDEAAAPAEESSDDDAVDVEEHLKDAVEGSLRLKRLLSRDDDEPGKKKRKVTAAEAEKDKKVKLLLIKWGLAQDKVVKHVLDGSSVEDLDELIKSGYVPDKFNEWKTTCELLTRYMCEMREPKLPRGTACDAVAAFSHRWKLDLAKDKVLRGLKHGELRFVLSTYDGSKELKEVIEEAQNEDHIDDYTTAASVPQAPGLAAMSRFTRLELIDPMADAAVFGDANLTFALKLAKHRKALGHVGRVIATTFEDLDTLRERYKEIDDSIKTLEQDYFAEVWHGVDCTRIAIDDKFKGLEKSLGAVYYNFPHSGAIGGFFDGHPVVNWRHENLMRLFFRSLRTYVKPGGFVKVASNCGAVGVRFSYIIGGALENEFLHIETVPFLEWHLHRYGRSYGDKRDIYKRPDASNNQSYNAQAADRDMVYCFCYAPTGAKLGPQQVRLPPNLKTLNACTDGPFKSVQGKARENLAQQLHNRFVTEISGTHVG